MFMLMLYIYITPTYLHQYWNPLLGPIIVQGPHSKQLRINNSKDVCIYKQDYTLLPFTL